MIISIIIMKEIKKNIKVMCASTQLFVYIKNVPDRLVNNNTLPVIINLFYKMQHASVQYIIQL